MSPVGFCTECRWFIVIDQRTGCLVDHGNCRVPYDGHRHPCSGSGMHVDPVTSEEQLRMLNPKGVTA